MVILNWLLGMFFLLSFLTFFNKDFVFLVICLINGLLLLPPSYTFLTSKLKVTIPNKIRYITVIVLFFISITIYPKNLSSNSQNIKTNVLNNKETKVESINNEAEVKTIPSATPTSLPTLTPTLTPTLIPTTRPTATITPTAQIYIPQPTSAPQTQMNQSGGYSCSCSKTCTQMISCEEAYYQLNQCGCSRRDGDHDGVPCEDICPGR